MRHYPDDEAMRISGETIYRTLFVQARGTLKKELLAHLRSRRMMRKSRYASTSGQSSAVKSKMPSQSVSVHLRLKSVRCPDIGKGTCSQERATPTSPPCSNAAPGS